jgi:hypothetical protein
MSNTITPTVFYRTLNMEGLEILSIVPICDGKLVTSNLHATPASSSTRSGG